MKRVGDSRDASTDRSSSSVVCNLVMWLAGAGRNWRTFVKAIGAAVTDPAFQSDGRGWRFLLMDQRNHGKSTLRYLVQAVASN